jgi:uncharacterized protein (DUF169 family)
VVAPSRIAINGGGNREDKVMRFASLMMSVVLERQVFGRKRRAAVSQNAAMTGLIASPM